MAMEQNMKDAIVEKAFEQYMTEGYEKVTISTLQKSMGMGRATMYYYFKSKEELFEEVMRRYYLDVINRALSMVRPETTILELVDIYVGAYADIAGKMAKLDNPSISFSSYMGILFYAFSHDKVLADKINEVRERIHAVWCGVIRKSIENGEIRGDVDVDTIANTFESVKGVFREPVADEGTIKRESEMFKASHLEIYKLLKNGAN